MTFLGLTGLVNFFSSAALAVLVWRRCPRRDLAITYGLVNVAIAGFSAFYFLWQSSSDATTAYFHLRALSLGGMWINQAFLYFILTYVGITPFRRKILWCAGIGNIVFSLLTWFGALFPAVEPRYGFGFWGIVTPWFTAYLIFWHSELLYTFATLMQDFRYSQGARRNQIKYMLVAFAVGYIGGITNWPMWYRIHFPPYLNGLISVYCAIMAYAMVKHQVMDINIVIRKTLVYSVISTGLAAIYVSTITVLAHVLGGRRGSASAFSSALAAIFITLIFNPLRTKTQRWINRYFPREQLDPELLQEAAGGFAHELKRPLSKISLPAEKALMDLERAHSGELSWEQAYPLLEANLRFIMNQSLDAGYMIEAIRELSTPGASFEEQDLPIVIQQALSAQNDLLEKNDVQVRLDLPQELPMVEGRARQLEIVFINLIKNAVEAMGGLRANALKEIRIDARHSENSVIVRLQDSGPGIKPEDLGKVFQATYTTKGSRGTGMGLYLSRQIVEGHEGTISIESNGAGAVFVVKLPAHLSANRAKRP